MTTAAAKPQARQTPLLAATTELARFEHDELRAAYVARAAAGLAKLARALTPAELGRAVAAPTDYGALVTGLLQPSSRDLFETKPLDAARLQGLHELEALLAAEGGTVPVNDVARILRISRQAVDRRRALGKLLAFEVGKRGCLYPVWQFAQGDLLPGLATVLAVLHESGLSSLAFLNFFLSGSYWVSKDGRTRPLDLVRQGDRKSLDQVLRAASMLGQQGAP